LPKLGHPRGKAEAFQGVLAVTADDLEYVAEALLNRVGTTLVSGVRPAGVYRFHCEDFAIAPIESRMF
jgi:hypothetical protein